MRPKARLMEPKHTTTSAEMDLHIWKKNGDEDVTDLYTVSAGKWSVCVDMPLDRAMESIREYMEEL